MACKNEDFKISFMLFMVGETAKLVSLKCFCIEKKWTFSAIFLLGAEEKNEPHAVVNAAMFTPFLQLLSPDVGFSVKSAFIKSMRRIFTHMTFTPDSAAHSSIVMATCCDLIEDPDFHVRLCFR